MRHVVALLLALLTPTLAGAATTIRVMPPDGGVLAAGQFVDIRVEATGTDGAAPSGLRVWVDGVADRHRFGRRHDRHRHRPEDAERRHLAGG